jgi:hypothetical protein
MLAALDVQRDDDARLLGRRLVEETNGGCQA